MGKPKISEIFFNNLPQLTGGTIAQFAENLAVDQLITDSRKASNAKNAVFFAITGPRHDGHQFIGETYRSGCRQFVVEKAINLTSYPGCNFLLVESSIRALQKIVAAHRVNFSLPVLGITGSNGKTIVKEWLYQLLAPDFSILKNPGSYNSQLGVPLSVWPMSKQHNFAIFEAGISKVGEMKTLAEVIQPTIGVFTNLLAAHDEGFASRKQKADEKAILFQDCRTVIYCKDHELVDGVLTSQKSNNQNLFTWGYSSEADVMVSDVGNGLHQFAHKGSTVTIQKDLFDNASWENLSHCVAVLIHLGYSAAVIEARVAMLKALPMRLEMKEGIDGSTIIDDSYSNDLMGLRIALDFLSGHSTGKSLVILSDMLETGMTEDEWIRQINQLLQQYGVNKLVAIGPAFSKKSDRLSIPVRVFNSVEALLETIQDLDVTNSTVLIKGARVFRLERIAQKLQKKIHGTMMEIDLGALVHNLNVFRTRLKASTKIMAMVKAFAYGSGSHEVASVLQYHKVDYLGVAYPDEGKILRAHGIRLPIMVMNPTPDSFRTLIELKLEPAIFSLSLLRSLFGQVGDNEVFIHLKLDTGMHRLGIEEDQLGEAIALIKSNPNVKINSVYSHLAGSDDSAHDRFSDAQVNRFEVMCHRISSEIKEPFLKHILNSSGISRLGQYQYDMVRLGIGLYGIDPSGELQGSLRSVVTLRATISQIKKIKAGETIGYGRHGKSDKEMKLATISIGYADGYSRAFSRGVGKVLVNASSPDGGGQLAPVVGNVCMDMTMVDITGIEAAEGDNVVIFGEGLPVSEVASWISTIPYEILTNTSDRVKRVFFAESL
jgi:Alr-MurF fusion protein